MVYITKAVPPLCATQDRGLGGGWYCFDDTSVEPWDPSRLAVDCFGGKYVPEGLTTVGYVITSNWVTLSPFFLPITSINCQTGCSL